MGRIKGEQGDVYFSGGRKGGKIVGKKRANGN